MKKLVCFVLVWCFVTGSAAALSTSAKGAALYDPLSGQLIYGYNADQRLPMASTTKIMTGLLAIELYGSDTEVKIKPEWAGIEGSSMYLKSGEVVTVRELIYGLMLMSGNDAATALAGMLSGKQADFVAMMNTRTMQMGLSNTGFENPSGLDGDGHYSSARDMAVMAGYALENPVFREIVSTGSITFGKRYMSNHNKLLWLYDGALGVKTGFTKKSGRCLVSAAEREGRTLIAVTLSAPDDWDDHTAMLDYGFDRFEMTQLVTPGNAGTAHIVSGLSSSSELYVNEGFSFSLSAEEREAVKIELLGPRFCYAPVVAGERYGALQVSLYGRILFETEVFFSDSVEEQPEEKGVFESLWEYIKNIFWK